MARREQLVSNDVTSRKDIIVVGASAGGLEALTMLVSCLPRDLGAAVFVVLHTSRNSPGLLPDILGRASALPVAYALDQEPITVGRVYVAPPDRHLLLERGRVRLTHGPKENRSRPAVDPLFRSAAYAYGPRVVGVVLTGSLDDGTAGLWTVKDCGGTAVVQDPEEAPFPSMPQSALRYVAVDHVMRIAEMAPLLTRLASEPAPAERARPMQEQSDELDIETRIAREDSALKIGVAELGSTTLFTCPECHGVLLRLKGGGIPRFRCHTGHAFSLDSLLAAATDSIEDALWTAIRAIEAGALLLKHTAQHARERHDIAGAERFEQKAREVERHADLVRRAVLRHEALSDGKEASLTPEPAAGER